MPKRAIALTAVLVTATLTPPTEAGADEPGAPPVTPPAPDLDETLANLELPSRPEGAPPVPAPPVVEASAASNAAASNAPVSNAAASNAANKSTGNGRARASRPGDPLSRIRACESGSNYQARSSSGRYRGAYQFDRATFASVGGKGDPAAASPAEQDHRARLLYAQRGGAPWPVCSGRG